MKYNQPYDQQLNPNAGYIDGNPSTGVAGSIPPAASLEYPQREIVNMIAASGQTPDNGDLFQLLRSARSGLLDYFNDNGSVNALSIAPTPAYFGLTAGNKFRIKTLNAPTGDTVCQVNSITAPVRKSGLVALSGGEWNAGDIITLQYDGTYLQLQGSGSSGSGISGQFITNNIILNVPAQYPSIRAALLAASLYVVASNVYVTIAVAAGYVENLTSVTGPLYISHPFGQRISIVGAALNGSCPTAADIDGKTPAAILTLLQSRFRVVVNAVGTDALQVRGPFGGIQNILFVGDGTNSGGHYGGMIGNWSGEIGTGSTAFLNCWFHGFGLANLRLEEHAFVQGNNLGNTCSNNIGAWIVHTSTLEVNFGNFLSMYNGAQGVLLTNYALLAIPSASGTMDISRNTSHGVAGNGFGAFNANPATGLNIKNNGAWGVYMSAFCNAALSGSGSTSFSGNASGDCLAQIDSFIATYGCSVGTCSPARGGGGGNTQSFIY